MADKTHDYLVRLRPIPGDCPPYLRLRRLLKFALRTLGLRCVEVREMTETPAAEGDQPKEVPS